MSFFKGIGRFLGLSSPRNSDNPAHQGMGYLNQVPGIGKQYLEPYIAEGREGDRGAMDALNRLIGLYENRGGTEGGNEGPWGEYASQGRDPVGFLNEAQRSYEPSAGYRYKENRMLGAARNSASSGGFAGTQYDQEQQANLIRELLGQDMQQYLSNVTGARTEGLSGLERMLEGRGRGIGAQAELGARRGERGFNAASGLADYLGSNLTQQGTLGYMGQHQRNVSRDTAAGNRLNLLSSGIGYGMGRSTPEPNRFQSMFGGG